MTEVQLLEASEWIQRLERQGNTRPAKILERLIRDYRELKLQIIAVDASGQTPGEAYELGRQDEKIERTSRTTTEIRTVEGNEGRDCR